jgi:hypothetical protein
VNVAGVVSHKFSFAEMGKAFETSLNGETMKVVITSEE